MNKQTTAATEHNDQGRILISEFPPSTDAQA
jgi:hypothetical protein